MMPQLDYKLNPSESLRARIAMDFALMCRIYYQRNADGSCTIAIMVDNSTSLEEPTITLSARAETIREAYESLKPQLMLLAK